jgi:type IV secretory pathway TrbF-like protein
MATSGRAVRYSAKTAQVNWRETIEKQSGTLSKTRNYSSAKIGIL